MAESKFIEEKNATVTATDNAKLQTAPIKNVGGGDHSRSNRAFNVPTCKESWQTFEEEQAAVPDMFHTGKKGFQK